MSNNSPNRLAMTLAVSGNLKPAEVRSKCKFDESTVHKMILNIRAQDYDPISSISHEHGVLILDRVQPNQAYTFLTREANFCQSPALSDLTYRLLKFVKLDSGKALSIRIKDKVYEFLIPSNHSLFFYSDGGAVHVVAFDNTEFTQKHASKYLHHEWTERHVETPKTAKDPDVKLRQEDILKSAYDFEATLKLAEKYAKAMISREDVSTYNRSGSIRSIRRDVELEPGSEIYNILFGIVDDRDSVSYDIESALPANMQRLLEFTYGKHIKVYENFDSRNHRDNSIKAILFGDDLDPEYYDIKCGEFFCFFFTENAHFLITFDYKLLKDK